MALFQNENGIISTGLVPRLSGTGNGTRSGVMATGAAAASAASSINVQARRNIYYALSYMLLLPRVTWSGNQYEFVLCGFGYAINSVTLTYQLPLLAIYTSSFINPIIYVIKYERFCKAVVLAFPGLRRRQRDGTTLPSTQLHNALTSI